MENPRRRGGGGGGGRRRATYRASGERLPAGIMANVRQVLQSYGNKVVSES